MQFSTGQGCDNNGAGAPGDVLCVDLSIKPWIMCGIFGVISMVASLSQPWKMKIEVMKPVEVVIMAGLPNIKSQFKQVDGSFYSVITLSKLISTSSEHNLSLRRWVK